MRRNNFATPWECRFEANRHADVATTSSLPAHGEKCLLTSPFIELSIFPHLDRWVRRRYKFHDYIDFGMERRITMPVVIRTERVPRTTGVAPVTPRTAGTQYRPTMDILTIA